MQVRLLGPIEVDEVILGGPTQRRIVAILALEAGDVVSVDRLVDATWADGKAPALAERNVRTYIHRLRVAFGSDGAARIETVPPGYRLRLEKRELDARHFEVLAASASRLADAGEVVAALDVIDEANRLWRGRPLGEFADEAWALPEVERLTEVQIGLAERRAEMLLEAGRCSEAVSGLEQLRRAVPLREQPRALLMRALYRSDRRVEALRAFQEYRSLLVEEIGVDPSDDLVVLDRAIATGDAELRYGSAATRSVGAYELHERIGDGAFATVHRATQPSLGRDVAIKVVHAELANRPVFIRRFEAEAQMVARVEHPNIVPLYDYWREPDQAFLVMRWMTGGSLEVSLDDGLWPVDKTVVMVEEIGGALAAAHDVGIVHRDVKPANILLDDQGRSYLADFGIALESEELTNPEVALSEGSPIYASPEQLRKETAGPASDIHALGIVAFRALSGQVPFPAGDPRTLLHRQLNDAIPPVRTVRRELRSGIDDVLAIATAKRPEDRYASAPEFAAALRAAALDGGGAETEKPFLAARPRANPYKGLRPFHESDASDFHGRERLVAEMLAAESNPDTGKLLAVVGPSGSGKSSVVLAALIPALRSGHVAGSEEWFITTMVPGVDPFEALETALLRVAVNPPASLLSQLRADTRGVLRGVRRVVPEDDDTLLVVIDQFEELFASDTNHSLVNAFLDALSVAVSEPASPLRIVLTLRADFYDRPLRHPKFAALLKQATVAVTPLAPDELERAIVAPAASVGVGFEPGLVARIAGDVSNQPGALPLLQYALTRAFDLTESSEIGIADYDSIGGLTGAVAHQAEEIWTAASTAEQLATRHVFGRLVSPGDGTEDTSRRVHRDELGNNPATTAVIDRLGQARLLTFDRDVGTREPTVEIAHEALLQEWPRLTEWLDEDRVGLRIHRHLTTAAAAWNERSRDTGDLYRGARLEMTEAWFKTATTDLNPTETEFLQSSTKRRNQEERTERNRLRRLRRLLVTTGVIAIVALVAGTLALRQQQRANEEARAAVSSAAQAAERATEAEQARTDAEAAEAQGDLDRMIALARTPNPNDPTVAILLALEAFRADPNVPALDAMHRALTGLPGYLGSLTSDTIGVEIIELDDGRRIVVNTADSVDVWDVANRKKVASWPFPGADNAIRVELRIDAPGDGRFAVAMAQDRTTTIDLNTGATLRTFEHPVAASAIALSPDGDQLAFGFVDGLVEVWDIDGGLEPFATLKEPATVGVLEWTPDGTQLAIGSFDGGITMWDPREELRSWEIRGLAAPTRENGAYGLLFSAAGDRLVVSTQLDATTVATNRPTGMRAMRVLDSETGVDLIEPVPDPFQRFSLRWMNNDETIVAARGAVNGAVEAFDLESGRPGTPLVSLTTAGGAIAVLDNPRVLLVDGPAGIDLFSIDRSGPLSQLIPLSREQADALGPREMIIGAFDENTAQFVTSMLTFPPLLPQTVDLRSTEPLASPYVAPANAPPSFIVDRFGSFTLNSGVDGFLVREGLNGRVIGQPIPRPPGLRAVALSPAGDRLVLVEAREDGRGVPVLYDIDTGAEVSVLHGVPNPVADITFTVAQFSPEGSVVLAWNGAGVAAFDAKSGAQLWTTTEFGYGLPGPTGSWIASVDDRGAIHLRDPLSLEITDGPLLGHVGDVTAMELSPDGTRLATLGRDDTARVWNLQTMTQLGRELPSLQPGKHYWSLDGTKLAVPTPDGYMLWNYDTDTWPDIACSVASRNLTQEEWDQFGPRTIERRATCPQFPLE